MAFAVKTLFGGPVKSISCCTSGGTPQELWYQPEPRVAIRGRRSSEEPRCRPLPPDTTRRDSFYMQQKAERALMREHIREKYNLTRNAQDQQQVRAARGNVQLSRDLQALVGQDQKDSEDFSAADLLTHMRISAHSTVGPLQTRARCLVM